jgi:polar amino acid transport system substrate-binding protein
MAVLLLLNPLNSSGAEENPPTIVYTIGPYGSPYYERDPVSQYGWKGLFIDILEEVMVKELGMKVVLLQSPWKRAQENVKDGTADIIVSVPTQDRLTYAFRSEEPILKMYLSVYTYTGHPKLEKIRKIQTPNDIIALNLISVTNQGNGWHKENIDAFGVKMFYVPNEENRGQFLAMRRGRTS